MLIIFSELPPGFEDLPIEDQQRILQVMAAAMEDESKNMRPQPSLISHEKIMPAPTKPQDIMQPELTEEELEQIRRVTERAAAMEEEATRRLSQATTISIEKPSEITSSAMQPQELTEEELEQIRRVTERAIADEMIMPSRTYNEEEEEEKSSATSEADNTESRSITSSIDVPTIQAPEYDQIIKARTDYYKPCGSEVVEHQSFTTVPYFQGTSEYVPYYRPQSPAEFIELHDTIQPAEVWNPESGPTSAADSTRSQDGDYMRDYQATIDDEVQYSTKPFEFSVQPAEDLLEADSEQEQLLQEYRSHHPNRRITVAYTSFIQPPRRSFRSSLSFTTGTTEHFRDTFGRSVDDRYMDDHEISENIPAETDYAFNLDDIKNLIDDQESRAATFGETKQKSRASNESLRSRSLTNLDSPNRHSSLADFTTEFAQKDRREEIKQMRGAMSTSEVDRLEKQQTGGPNAYELCEQDSFMSTDLLCNVDFLWRLNFAAHRLTEDIAEMAGRELLHHYRSQQNPRARYFSDTVDHEYSDSIEYEDNDIPEE